MIARVPTFPEPGACFAVTPTEASVLAGLSVKAIHAVVDDGEIQLSQEQEQPSATGERRSRVLTASDVVYLAVRQEVGQYLSAQGRAALYECLGSLANEWSTIRDLPLTQVAVGPLNIDVTSAGPRLQAGTRRYELARKWVVKDPEVRAGEPTVRGTRVTVATIAALHSQGAPLPELLEDYPALSPDSLEGALAYAAMYPRRGRPKSPSEVAQASRSGSRRKDVPAG